MVIRLRLCMIVSTPRRSDHNSRSSSSVGLVDNPVREVADHEIRAIGEEIMEPAVHLYQLPESWGTQT